jgi:hypothetical protein
MKNTDQKTTTIFAFNRNYKTMKYFLPDWEDRVYPHFNFEEDFSPSISKNAYEESVYAHEIFAEPPYDGLLISLALYTDKHLYFENGKPLIRGFSDIRKYLCFFFNENFNSNEKTANWF